MLLGLLEDYAPLSIIPLLPSNRLLPFSNRGAAISHLKEKSGPTLFWPLPHRGPPKAEPAGSLHSLPSTLS